MSNTNSIKATARRAGALYLLFLIVGLVDMFGFFRFLVPGDASAKSAEEPIIIAIDIFDKTVANCFS